MTITILMYMDISRREMWREMKMELVNVYRVALMVPAQGHPYDLDYIKIYDNLPEALTYFNELGPEAINQSKYWGDNVVSILLEDMYNDAPAYPIEERKFVEGKEVKEDEDEVS